MLVPGLEATKCRTFRIFLVDGSCAYVIPNFKADSSLIMPSGFVLLEKLGFTWETNAGIATVSFSERSIKFLVSDKGTFYTPLPEGNANIAIAFAGGDWDTFHANLQKKSN